MFTGSQAFFESRRVPVAAPLLEEMLPLASEAGLELHAWIVSLRSSVPALQEEHPEWFTVSRAGLSSLENPPYLADYQWLCPQQPGVVSYLKDIVAELGGYPELKGIHLDYIRHADVILPVALRPRYNLIQDRELPQFDFCYCPVCREAFRSLHGVDPLRMEDPSADIAWREFRLEGVRSIVAAAAQTAHGLGKGLSAAVFATPELSRAYVRQDWPRWDLDAVLPMIYHPYYSKPVAWIEDATREGVEALRGERPLYSGLFVPGLSPAELAQAVDCARKGGAAGVCLFSQGAMTEEHYRALRRGL